MPRATTPDGNACLCAGTSQESTAMNPFCRHALLGLSAFAATSALADVTFFDQQNFGGRQYRLDRSTASFGSGGINDRSQSAIVDGGAWEICVNANFGGGCTVLAPGRYATLGGWADRISSARPVGAPVVALPPTPVASPAAGRITFFQARDFGGRPFAIDQSLPNFDSTGANDRAVSVIVEGGSWEVCVDADFRGECRMLAPGRYATLDSFTNRISSARPSYDAGDRDRERGRGRGRASATLFSNPNFTGQAFTLGGEGATNLDGQFNDRASSLRVERGYWIFCSDADFRGECQTFGPGEYPSLPPELNHRVSSGRRVSNNYPYAGNPNWRN